MFFICLLLLFSLIGLAACLYLLGFGLGRDGMREELLRVRATAAQGSVRMRELTRAAMTAMADEAFQRRRRP